MKEFLEYLVKSLVQHPDQVIVDEENPQPSFFILKIKVAKEDMGLIIGKEGRVIKALRSIMRLKALRENKKIQVVLLEDEEHAEN